MRRKAAAVPASKARIGTTYAVEREGELTRFVVNKITTHRVSESGSPHDYESEITGNFLLTNKEGDGVVTEKAVIKPSRLLGQFEEYKELVAQRDAEHAAQKAKNAALTKTATDLAALLYDFTGLPIPNDQYRQNFKARYDSGIEMDKEGAKALLEKLREILERSKS